VNSLDEIAANLCVVFPHFTAIMPLRLLGSGFRSVVVETGDGIVFRIAKNQEAANGYAREARLLPYLRPRVLIAVPDPRWLAGPSEHFPFGVMGYPKLPGTPLSPERLARADVSRLASDIARFLLALHRIPVEEVTALGLPGSAVCMKELDVTRDAVLPPLRDALTNTEYDTVRRWWEQFLADETMRAYKPALQHGDFWHENMLVDDTSRSLLGVVDFENAAVGDPAQDVATQLHLGDAFAAQVIDAYRTLGGTLDATFDYRTRRLWELRVFDGLAFAVRHADSAEFDDAVRKLREGPILNPRVA